MSRGLKVTKWAVSGPTAAGYCQEAEDLLAAVGPVVR